MFIQIEAGKFENLPMHRYFAPLLALKGNNNKNSCIDITFFLSSPSSLSLLFKCPVSRSELSFSLFFISGRKEGRRLPSARNIKWVFSFFFLLPSIEILSPSYHFSFFFSPPSPPKRCGLPRREVDSLPFPEAHLRTGIEPPKRSPNRETAGGKV